MDLLQTYSPGRLFDISKSLFSSSGLRNHGTILFVIADRFVHHKIHRFDKYCHSRRHFHSTLFDSWKHRLIHVFFLCSPESTFVAINIFEYMMLIISGTNLLRVCIFFRLVCADAWLILSLFLCLFLTRMISFDIPIYFNWSSENHNRFYQCGLLGIVAQCYPTCNFRRWRYVASQLRHRLGGLVANSSNLVICGCSQ